MPYDIKREGPKSQVVNEDTGDVKGTHDTDAEAQAQLSALYANAAPEGEDAEKCRDAEKLTELPGDEDMDDKEKEEEAFDEAPLPEDEAAKPGASPTGTLPPDARPLKKPTAFATAPTSPMPLAAVAKIDPSGHFEAIIPITKVDEERREVWGWGAIEQPDNSSEVLDYDSSKPFFNEWTAAAQKRSGGRSFGNLRSMHQPIAAGKLISFQPDDRRKGFYVGARIVDDNEWRKVEEGVYTGFSVGGAYARRWPDPGRPGLVRYTAKPTEMSIVDSPCIPDATFQIVKTAEVVAKRFAPGSGANLLTLEPDDGSLEKQGTGGVPRKPEPIATEPYANKPYQTFNVERMPPQNAPIELKDPGQDNGPDAGTVPSQEELAQAAVRSRDLQAAIDAWMPKVAAMFRKVVQTELANYGFTKTTSTPRRMIPVVRNNHFIKVTPKGERK